MHETFTITEIYTENYRAKTFVFDKPLPGATPGQFVMAWLPGVGEKPFSIMGRDPLTLMVVAVGPFSEAMHRLHIGDRVWVRGPLGQGYTLQGQHLLLVGGGYGVAPLLFLAHEALAAGYSVEVYIGARTAEEVLLAEDFVNQRQIEMGRQRATGNGHVTLHITTEDGSRGARGLVTQATATAIATQRPDCVYACGPVPMLVALAQQCQTHALPHQLSWEARIRCGMGICGDCELEADARTAAHIPPGWRVCRDGPVYTSMVSLK
ncbi:MAG: hypothetical protein JXA33_28475 [Anaerolineae bacterium]|nr:hypothetical protein [Anaerolineae bacterium]